jgi:hypothetical protein
MPVRFCRLSAFPTDDEVDVAQFLKLYGPEYGNSDSEGKYSPGEMYRQ